MARIPLIKANSIKLRTSLWLVLALFCSALMFVDFSYGQDRQYYRVINERGVTELKSSLSPAEAKRGYAIVTLGGHIIKEVPAELSDEEFAQLSDELKKRELVAQQEQEAREYNESLLLRYSTVDDLEAERQRKLSEFDVRISILRSNMMSLKDQVERQQSRAANIERTGREVPVVIGNNIAELEQKLKEADTSLKSMDNEKDKVDQRYALDIERFSQLVKKHTSTDK